MHADLSPVEARLLAILRREAAPALSDGRAEIVITTQRQFWGLPEGRAEGDRMVGLIPKAGGAARVGVIDGKTTDQVGGWHLFVGDGPHFEFWEGTEADYERTEQIVRAAVEGQCRYWWSREDVREFLRPWRKHPYWQQHSEIVLPDGSVRSTYAGGGVFPKDGEPEAVQAAPY